MTPSPRKNNTSEYVRLILQEEIKDSDGDDYSDSNDSNDNDECDEVLSPDSCTSDEEIENKDSESIELSESEPSETTFISKNGLETCFSTPMSSRRQRKQHKILRKDSGQTRYAYRECVSISSAFQLFFRPQLLNKICMWTNRHTRAIDYDWKDIDQVELKKVIGTLILIGVYKSKNEDINVLWSKEDGRPIFNKIISRTRF